MALLIMQCTCGSVGTCDTLNPEPCTLTPNPEP